MNEGRREQEADTAGKRERSMRIKPSEGPGFPDEWKKQSSGPRMGDRQSPNSMVIGEWELMFSTYGLILFFFLKKRRSKHCRFWEYRAFCSSEKVVSQSTWKELGKNKAKR